MDLARVIEPSYCTTITFLPPPRTIHSLRPWRDPANRKGGCSRSSDRQIFSNPKQQIHMKIHGNETGRHLIRSIAVTLPLLLTIPTPSYSQGTAEAEENSESIAAEEDIIELTPFDHAYQSRYYRRSPIRGYIVRGISQGHLRISNGRGVRLCGQCPGPKFFLGDVAEQDSYPGF